MLCQECKKRDKCVKLCPEAEKYVNRDRVSQRESCHEDYVLDWLNLHVSPHPFSALVSFWQEDNLNFPFLSPLQNKCLHLFYFEGLSYVEIAFRLSNQYRQVSSHKVRGQIYRAKQKIREFSSISRRERNEIVS